MNEQEKAEIVADLKRVHGEAFQRWEKERADLRAERDRAREECGHEKAMRASIRDELYRFVALQREEKERADALAAKVEWLEGLARSYKKRHDHIHWLATDVTTTPNDTIADILTVVDAPIGSDRA